jgi:hypothetical protein
VRSKISRSTILIMAVLAARLWAQDSTSYFPLHLGDFWRYKGDEQPWASTKAVDTANINGNTYYILSGILAWSWTLPYPDTVRIIGDSDVVFYRSGKDRLFYKLNAAVGDTWSYSIETPGPAIEHVVTLAAKLDSFRVQQGPLRGSYRNVAVFFNNTPGYSDGWSYDYLAPGLGLIFRYWQMDRRTLYGAVVNGKLYGDTTTTVVKVVEDPIPGNFRLLQNYPNPFNSTTTVTCDLISSTHVELVVYDLLGRKIRTLVEGVRPAGRHSIMWDGKDDNGKDLSSGVYIIVLHSPDLIYARRTICLK